MFRIFGVPEVLRNDVECFIANEFTSEAGVEIHTFPSAIPGIVFHHKKGGPAIERIITPSRCKISPPTLFVHNAGTESSVMHFGEGSYSVIQVILKPHALQSLLGINAMILKADVAELNELVTENLNDQLMDTNSIQEQVALLTKFLISKLKPGKNRDLIVEESLCLIHRSRGMISVKSLLSHLHISERQLERRFCQAVGLPPLAYIRFKRFNEAMRLMQSEQYDTLTEVAHALNFHDQSHFIREIKTFTGITPKGLSQKVRDFAHTQAGYSYI